MRPDCPGASRAGSGDCAFACGAAKKAAPRANMTATAVKRIMGNPLSASDESAQNWNVRGPKHCFDRPPSLAVSRRHPAGVVLNVSGFPRTK
jgi:hypothetical protein